MIIVYKFLPIFFFSVLHWRPIIHPTFSNVKKKKRETETNSRQFARELYVWNLHD